MIARVDGPESINFPFNINIFNAGSGRSFASSVITHRRRGSRRKNAPGQRGRSCECGVDFMANKAGGGELVTEQDKF